MTRRDFHRVFALVAAGIVSVAAAQTPASTADPMAEAEVRKVDKEAGKITLKHGPIPKLDMPAMTMVFQVKDKAMLDQVKAGDKVRFEADRIGGQFTVVKIEPMK
jgi:Cu(I)/Ag(I) efflux system protein CusF